MKKVITWPLAAIALLPSVLAQSPLQSVLGMFERTIGFLFVGGLDMANFEIWGKFLLWILLFAIFIAALNSVKIFEGKKNIRAVVAAIIALISVIAMPQAIVRAIFVDYGIVVSFLLLAIPLIAVIYLLEVALKAGFVDGSGNLVHSRAYHGIKAVGYYILGFVITQIANVATSFNPTMQEIWSFAAGVCFLLFLWNLVACIFGGAGKDEKGFEGDGKGLKKFFKWFNKKPEVETETIPATSTSPERVTLARAINKVGKGVDKFLAKTLTVVYPVVDPTGRSIAKTILTLYKAWLNDPARAGLETELNRQYDELAKKMHDMSVAAEAINDQFEAILSHPQFDEISDGEKAAVATYMSRMARGHSKYADGLLLFYSDMAEVGR